MMKLFELNFLELLATPHSPAELASALHPRLGVAFGGPSVGAVDTLPEPATIDISETGRRAGSTSGEPDAALRARFTSSGVSVRMEDSETILEAAESAGLEPRTGCRRGVCHRCVRPLTDGVSRNSRDGTISAAGDTVRICVSTAMTDVEVDL